MFITIFFIVVLSFIAVVLAVNFSYIVFSGYAPFFATSGKILDRVVNELNLKDNAAIYELGCGRAGFLRRIEKKFPKMSRLVVVEYFLMPFIIAGIQLSFQKSKIKILKKNLFDVNLKEADIIYCFLNKQAMKKLKEKFLKECKRGVQIISYQFSLPDMAPEKVIDINENNRDKVYFYKM